MKIDIIIAYIQRYKFGHEIDFVASITGVHLAALTPKEHTVRVIHQQVDKINYNTDADLVMLSFFSGFATEAFTIAAKLRKNGKKIIAGGPHVTFWPNESVNHFDVVVTGECESVWKDVLKDAEAGKLQKQYDGKPTDLTDIPTPRYDLLSNRFIIKRVVQATRGCPYKCSFCTVPSLNLGFRMRPIERVMDDIRYNSFKHWWQRKVVWFWDDNLTVNRPYIKELLTKMIPLKRWWLTQASIDIVNYPELLDLMKASGCIGIFLGIESFSSDSLKNANKKQNHINQYRKAVTELHKRGISVMVGLISGFDSDTPESIVAMADNLMEIGFDVPFLSILTPYKGTDLYEELEKINDKKAILILASYQSGKTTIANIVNKEYLKTYFFFFFLVFSSLLDVSVESSESEFSISSFETLFGLIGVSSTIGFGISFFFLDLPFSAENESIPVIKITDKESKDTLNIALNFDNFFIATTLLVIS